MKTEIMAIIAAGCLCLPIAASAENRPAYPYGPYPYYGGNNSDFLDNGSFSGDSWGQGSGRGKGEAEFSMSISGKARGEQTRDGSFGSSGYGGNSKRMPPAYRAPYPYPNPYPYYGSPALPASPSS